MKGKKSTGAVREAGYPYAIAVAMFGATALGWVPFPHNAAALLNSVGNTTGVFVGFALSAMAVLLAFQGHEHMKAMRRAGAGKTLGRYMFEAALFSLLSLVLSVALTAVDKPLAVRWVYALWAFLSTASILTTFRVLHLLFKTLHVDD